MSHVFHQLYYHFVWGTHDRQPLIVDSIRPEMLRIQAEEVSKLQGILVRHNALHDHVHLLARLSPHQLVSEFIGRVKGAVTYRVNKELTPPIPLKWQEGYGVVSIREGDVDKVSRYIDQQQVLHTKRKLSLVLEILEAS